METDCNTNQIADCLNESGFNDVMHTVEYAVTEFVSHIQAQDN